MEGVNNEGKFISTDRELREILVYFNSGRVCLVYDHVLQALSGKHLYSSNLRLQSISPNNMLSYNCFRIKLQFLQ